jgi:Peptidase family S41
MKIKAGNKGFGVIGADGITMSISNSIWRWFGSAFSIWQRYRADEFQISQQRQALTKATINKLQSLLIGLLLILFPVFTNAQQDTYDPLKYYSPNELKEDFNYFRDKLEKYHPNLYLYNSKQTVDSAFDYLLQSIDSAMTDLQFYSHISRMIPVIKDGHNIILPGKASVNYYNKNAGFLPYTLYSIGEKLYCVQNCTANTSIKDGTEIVSINGIASKRLIDELLNRQLRDGYNETYPRWIINTYFRGYYSFIYGHPAQYAIVYKEDNYEKTYTAKSLPLDSIRYYRQKKYPAANVSDNVNKGISLIINKEIATATITIPSFDNNTFKKEYKQSYGKEIRSYFKIIRKNNIQHLIIDIRGNQGGNPMYVRKLLTRLFIQRFTMALQAGKVKNPQAAEWSERNKKKYFPQYAIGSFHPNKNAFAGKLYVLIDGGTYSAAGQFSSVIEKYNRGVFIGEETGGNKAIIGGFFFPRKNILPHTGIEFSPARLYTFYREPGINDGHGVKPSNSIVPTLNDILEGKDPVKEFIFKLIQSTLSN